MGLRPRQRSVTVRGRVIASPLSARHYVVLSGVTVCVVAIFFLGSAFGVDRTDCDLRYQSCVKLNAGEVNFASWWWGFALAVALIMFFRNIYLMRLVEHGTGDAESSR